MAKLLDPVCGMTVDETALQAPGHDDVAFCSPGCRNVFLKDPDAFPARLGASGPVAGKCGCNHETDGSGHEAHGLQIADGPQLVASNSGCCGGSGS